MSRILFELSMPNTPTWNGSWSGAGKSYNLVRSLPTDKVEELGIPRSWRYAWDDGWVASVSAKKMEKGERKPKSDGFLGYGWMVDNIVRWGTPYCQHEMKPDERHTTDEETWERCRWCSMSRKVDEATA